MQPAKSAPDIIRPRTPAIGDRGILRAPHMPDVHGLAGTARVEHATGALDFELDHQPITMIGRVLRVERQDVEWL